MSDGKYALNIFKMTIMWTVASFTNYMLQFMNKYFEGSIYLNFYLDSAAGVVACFFIYMIYHFFRMRWAFITSLALTLISGIFLLCFQQGYIEPDFVDSFHSDPCPFEDPEDRRTYFLG